MAKKEPAVKKIIDADIEAVKTKAVEVQKELMTDITQIKAFLEHVQAKIEDSKIAVGVNAKGEVEIEFMIKALIKKK